MEYRTLQGTDIELSAITYGSMTFAGREGEQSERTEEGKHALNLALDMGVNCIHSSYEYGTRHAIKEVLAERSDAKNVRHIIKIRTYDRKTADIGDAAYLRKRVEQAMDDMGVECIDILQWIISHSTPTSTAPGQADAFMQHLAVYQDDCTAVFEQLKDEGKTRVLGHFVYNAEYASRMVDAGLIGCLLFYHNMWDTTILPAMEHAAERGMSSIVLRPFSGGMLTTKRADRHNLPPDDKYLPEKRMQLLIDRDRVLEEVGVSPENLSELAVKFDLAHPAIASVITGMNTCEQVKEILGYVDGNYPDAALHRKLFDACGKLGVGATL